MKILITSLVDNAKMIRAIKELRACYGSDGRLLELKEAKDILDAVRNVQYQDWSNSENNRYGDPIPVVVEVQHYPTGEYLNFEILDEDPSEAAILRRTLGLIKLMDFDIKKVHDVVELLDLTDIRDCLKGNSNG